MGTSAGKNIPSGGDWTPLKIKATQFVKAGTDGNVTPTEIVTNYLKANGGIENILKEKAGGGSKGHHIGKSARATSTKFGTFLSNFTKVGLDESLREIGLSNLIGQPVEKVISGLLDTFAGPSSTLDDHAARIALSQLLDELLGNTNLYSEIDEKLKLIIDEKGINIILARFFGLYIFEIFCRDFYENWLKRVGTNKTKQKLKEIKECILAEVEAYFAQNIKKSTNLKKAELNKLTDKVLKDTKDIFEVK